MRRYKLTNSQDREVHPTPHHSGSWVRVEEVERKITEVRYRQFRLYDNHDVLVRENVELYKRLKWLESKLSSDFLEHVAERIQYLADQDMGFHQYDADAEQLREIVKQLRNVSRETQGKSCE